METASNILQTVSFYNTTGVIEKEHNIYFCPNLSGTGQVRTLWLSAFNLAVVSHESMTIGQWQPDDKSLVVKGNIDNFRNAYNLPVYNYMILTREVTDANENVSTYYYAYFINGVTQVGNNSVRLELEHDYFTEVFYLQNVKTQDYNTVFTDLIKNSYVKRQHLDRVTYTMGRTSNELIFGNYQEQFVYKKQYRKTKRPLFYGETYFTDAEKSTIISSTWVNLSDTIKVKVLKACCAFLHVVINKNTILVGESTALNQKGFDSPVTYLPRTRPLSKNNLTKLVCPIAVIPAFLNKYADEINSIYNNIALYLNSDRLDIEQEGYTRAVALRNLLENEYLREYIVSAYITRESYLYSKLTFSTSLISMNVLEYATNANRDEKDDYFAVYLSTDSKSVMEDYLPKVISREISYIGELDSEHNRLALRFHTNDGTYINNGNWYICLIEREDTINFNVNLNEFDVIPNVTTTFYDPVLSYNPYSFVSVSYLGLIEVPLNKVNYGANNIVSFDLTVSVSDVCKYTLIPSYLVGNGYQKYYQESLITTFANQLTIVTDKLVDYVIANQTQMKNQYAINDLNVGKGMINGAIATGAGALRGAMFGGATGAGMGAVAGGASAIESVVSWGFNQAETALNQKAKLADVGNLPNNLKQVGTDINIDILTDEFGLYLNYYTIDDISYNSICRYLERYGYIINIYDEVRAFNRRSWNYVELIDFELDRRLSTEQENSIRQIFTTGVTLLHRPQDLHASTYVHNYEAVLE